MSAILSIRKRLDATQAELATAIGVSQGNVSFYEKGQTVPPAVAARLIEYARSRGHALTYDHIYGDLPLPDLAGAESAPTPEPKAA